MRRKLLILMIALVAMLYEFTGIRIATASDSVVRIGSEYYSSIDTAVAASKTGDIIEFMCNTEWTVPIVVEAEKSIIIDFRGYSITFPENTTAPSLGGQPYIDVRGDLTLRNGNVSFGKLGAGMGIQNNGKLTIDSGTYKLRIPATATSSGDMICNYGELIINGGTFDSDDILYQDKNSSLSQQVAPSLTINGGTFICPSNANNLLWAKAGSVTVNGGVFSKVGLRCENECEINDGSFNCHLCFFGPTIIKGGEFKCAFGGFCGDYDDPCIRIGDGTSLSIFGGEFDELDIVNRSSKVSVYGGRFKTTNALVIDEQKYIVTPVTQLFGGIYQTKPSESRIAIRHEIKYKQGVGYEIIPIGFCAKRDGWPIPNYYKSFGYELNENGEYYYDDPMKFFSQGFNISSLIASIFSLKYQGNCFGLSLLAAAQYNNQIDLLQYLYPNGDNLNEKGYNKIIKLNNNKYMYSLEGNDEVVDIIERANLSQFSSNIDDAELGSWDWSYSKVLDHLLQDNPSPLVVNLDFSYGSGGGHTVVTDTTRKPEKVGDGIWKIYCYDPNSPQDSKGTTNLVDWYYASEPYLCLNTKQHTWYYQNDWQESIYNYSYLSGKGLLPCASIKFYDISKLTDRFFYNDFDLFEQGKLDSFISDNITIYASQNQVLFKMEDNNPIVINNEIIYRKLFGNSVDTIPRSTIAALSLPLISNPIISCQGETRFLHNNNGEQLVAFFVDGNACVSLNDSSNLVKIQNEDDDARLFFEIAIQNQDGKRVVYAKGTLESDTNIVLQTQFSDNGDIVSAQTTSDENLIETQYILNGNNEKTNYHKRGVLNGTLSITGEAVYNGTLIATESGTNNTGVLTFSWKRNGVVIGTGKTYTPTVQDIGKSLTCEVTSTVETGCISAATAVITKQAGPAAPMSLIGVAPTLFNGRNGKIVGTTAEMELSDAASFASTIACGNGETGSLEAGTYYVRYKETETTYAGEYATVVVPEYIKKSPVIQYPEGNQTVNVEIGQTASMSVVAENGTDYQWFVDRNDGKGFVAIHGAENEGYTTTPTKKENEGYRYFCRVTNIDGFVDSPIFTLHVVQLDSLPETGDHSNWVYWMIMAVACTAAVFLLVHKQRAE